jgi:hypothetical protein
MAKEKFYTCREIIEQKPFTPPVLCLKPTVGDRYCAEHEAEHQRAENPKRIWP